MIKLLFFLSLLILSSCQSNTNPIDTNTSSWTTNKTIIALWDSLTAGLGLPEEDSYPAQLEKKLTASGYRYNVTNAWVSWDTTAALLSRLDWVLEWQTPNLIILCIGANDALQGKEAIDTEKTLRKIIEKIQDKKIPILFIGMQAPHNMGQVYRDEFSALYPRLAEEYILHFMPFFLDDVAMKPLFNQADKIHPTKTGYAIIVENIVEILEKEKLINK